MKKKEADIYAITHLSRNAKDRAIYAVYFAFLCTSLLLGLVLMVIWPAFISSIDSTLIRFVLPFLFIAAVLFSGSFRMPHQMKADHI